MNVSLLLVIAIAVSLLCAMFGIDQVEQLLGVGFLYSFLVGGCWVIYYFGLRDGRLSTPLRVALGIWILMFMLFVVFPSVFHMYQQNNLVTDVCECECS